MSCDYMTFLGSWKAFHIAVSNLSICKYEWKKNSHRSWLLAPLSESVWRTFSIHICISFGYLYFHSLIMTRNFRLLSKYQHIYMTISTTREQWQFSLLIYLILFKLDDYSRFTFKKPVFLMHSERTARYIN